MMCMDFGDPFLLEALSLPRPAGGYAVQYLGKDQLLDKKTGNFLSIRNPELSALFSSFPDACAAAQEWIVKQQGGHVSYPLAIVPAAFDAVSDRHILIYGVLQPELDEVDYLLWCRDESQEKLAIQVD